MIIALNYLLLSRSLNFRLSYKYELQRVYVFYLNIIIKIWIVELNIESLVDTHVYHYAVNEY